MKTRRFSCLSGQGHSFLEAGFLEWDAQRMRLEWVVWKIHNKRVRAIENTAPLNRIRPQAQLLQGMAYADPGILALGNGRQENGPLSGESSSDHGQCNRTGANFDKSGGPDFISLEEGIDKLCETHFFSCLLNGVAGFKIAFFDKAPMKTRPQRNPWGGETEAFASGL